MKHWLRLAARDRLAWQQARYAMFVAFGLGALMSGAQLLTDYYRERTQVETTVVQAVAIMQRQAARAIFDIDADLAVNVVEGLLEYQPVFSVELRDAFGVMLLSKERASQPRGDGTIARWLFGDMEEYRVPLRYYPDEAPIGELNVVMDSTVLAQNFVSRAVVTLTAGFLRNCLLALVLWLLFYLTLARPIVALAQQVGAVSTDAPETIEGVGKGVNRRNELGLLSYALNRLLAGFATSLRQRKAAEQQLRLHQEALEARVAARTTELEDVNIRLARQCELAQKRADDSRLAWRAAHQANAEKSRFIAAASHDLRQPLQALQFLLGAMKKHVHGPEGQKLYCNTLVSANSLQEWMNTLLDISQLEAGVLKVDRQPVDIGLLMRSVASVCQTQAAERGLEIRVRSGGYWVDSDAKLLQRVLLNLVTNAIKNTVDGGVLLAARKQGSRLQLQVFDTGVGFEAEMGEEIFEEFRSFGSEPGTGIGLSIVKRVCQLLEHPIRLRSNCGRGSCFSIEVPAAAARSEPPPLPRLNGQRISDMRVLVVDDDPQILRGLGALLESWSNVVLLASGARQAQEISAGGVDLIICDYHLHGHGAGIGLIKTIQQGHGQDIPAILITGDTRPDLLKRFASSGLVVLHKPVSPPRLRAACNYVLKQRTSVPV
ncbi:hybrid sensor histidine kinase/response regulator [Allohahella marinimesophila]|uniref:histidine kinase n=1 Tax=Allohahella marinimesophila TaxID=1054972 RepID=A0ABP7NZN2_9GAMM